jgi:threonine/homoserine/homoserine lactone efflux protein
LAPALSDAPIAALALLILTQVASAVLAWLQLAGGLMLLYLAWHAYRQLGQSNELQPAKARQQTLAQAILVNLLNPNPYLGWTLVLGPLVQRAWLSAPAWGVATVVAFYGTFALALLFLIRSFGLFGRLTDFWRHRLQILSLLLLLALAAYLIISSAAILVGGQTFATVRVA